ncbi:hypothetical protein WDW37_16595 [Bdellovibrionota bacterium FG-1]
MNLNPLLKSLRSPIFLVTLSLSLCRFAAAEIPTKLEPIYAEAVLAYNGKDYNKSLSLLDELLRQKPSLTEALELKALNLKFRHDDVASAQVYQDLIRAKLADKKTEKEVAPYRYELGLIHFRSGRVNEGRRELEGALKEDFNAPATHFFLGLIDFRGNALHSAEEHFKEVSSSGLADLKPAADFYLGQIYSKLGQASGATQRFFLARNGAKEVLDDDHAEAEAKKVAGQIRDATEAALKPFDHSGPFGNIGLSIGYDTNALSIPSAQISVDPTLGGNAHTAKTNLTGGVGYMSSPLNKWQFVPSYRGALNYNLNSDAKTSEFFNNDFSLYITRNALARFSWGMKLEAVYIFQNTGDPTTRFHFGSYSLLVPLGPYFRYELGHQFVLSIDLTVAPGSYFLDTDSAPTLKRGGLDSNLRVSVRNERGDRYWNPTFSVLLDSNSTNGRSNSMTSNGVSGAEFSSTNVNFELSDVMRLMPVFTETLTMDIGFPRYADRADGPRQDRVYSFDAASAYRLTPKYTLMGDLAYVYNASNVDSLYQFTRFMISVGASYSF